MFFKKAKTKAFWQDVRTNPKYQAWLEGLLEQYEKYKETEKSEIVFNNYFIKYFNKFNKIYLDKTNIKSNVHTLDCSILSVNIDNPNFEGSTITCKGNKKLRGYKIGVLRGMTPNAGVIEEICMSTAKTHDLTMSKDMILNSEYLKSGDYLLMDRGFLDIDFFKELTKKGIKVIIPAKKNMEIYTDLACCIVGTLQRELS